MHFKILLLELDTSDALFFKNPRCVNNKTNVFSLFFIVIHLNIQYIRACLELCFPTLKYLNIIVLQDYSE